MADREEIVANDETIEDEESSMVVTFNKPFKFEGEEYTEIDLSGIDDLTGQDMLELQKVSKITNARGAVLPEMDLGYAFHVASKVTKLPLEFFEKLPARECVKVRTMVTRGFFGED